jgi:hypothetical protein
MSLSPISGSGSIFLDLIANKGPGSSAPAGVADPSSASSSGSADLSDAAKFFSKLENLSQTDPAKFKRLTTQISSELQTAAQGATGSQATFLSDLANQFQTASQTGSVSPLHPPSTSQPAAGGHHHHHHAHYQSSSDASSTASDGLLSAVSSNSADPSSTSNVFQSIFQQVESA